VGDDGLVARVELVDPPSALRAEPDGMVSRTTIAMTTARASSHTKAAAIVSRLQRAACTAPA
jgi:hypothetical protein